MRVKLDFPFWPDSGPVDFHVTLMVAERTDQQIDFHFLHYAADHDLPLPLHEFRLLDRLISQSVHGVGETTGLSQIGKNFGADEQVQVVGSPRFRQMG